MGWNDSPEERVAFRKWWTKLLVIVGLAACAFVALGMAGCPVYNVWQQGLTGKAELSRAEQNRQIEIQKAKATDEAAAYYAQAEIKRAHGVAKANEIIGTSLKDNEAYLRWLWIEGMKKSDQKSVIYVPTETNLPILEASRFKLNEQPDSKKK
jgi:hypothetical protein